VARIDCAYALIARRRHTEMPETILL
jgi:hypothetical protein